MYLILHTLFLLLVAIVMVIMQNVMSESSI